MMIRHENEEHKIFGAQEESPIKHEGNVPPAPQLQAETPKLKENDISIDD
jgi:hypothetical protein